MENNEVWKDIPGLEGFYQASSLGRIRSLDRTIVAKNRWNQLRERKQKGKIIFTQKVSNSGYHYITVRAPGIDKTVWVHKMVNCAFRGVHFLEKFVTNHINGIKTDNRPENLEMLTTRQNALHSRNVLRKRGKYLNLDDVAEIIKLSAGGMMTKDIAKKYNLARQSVSGILTGRFWPSSSYPELEAVRRNHKAKVTHKKHIKEVYD